MLLCNSWSAPYVQNTHRALMYDYMFVWCTTHGIRLDDGQRDGFFAAPEDGRITESNTLIRKKEEEKQSRRIIDKQEVDDTHTHPAH